MLLCGTRYDRKVVARLTAHVDLEAEFGLGTNPAKVSLTYVTSNREQLRSLDT